MRETPEAGRKRIDLSVPQVAGSAVAAVVAAKLASYVGVYGTILGAGVVSVVATCGGTVFQHFFKRTGEQLREATVAPRPRGQVPPAVGEFTEATVYRARVRSRRRLVVAAAVVFGVAMGGITAYELVSGNSFSGGSGTTVSDVVTGRVSGSSSSTTEVPVNAPETPAPSDTPSRAQPPDAGAGTAHGATPSPGDPPGGETGDGPSPSSPAPTPSGSAVAPTTPEPSASSRSGTGVPGQDGPSGQ
ncbi:hypothetical protein SRB17_64120 [Streptomyces sp. RB17]|nr:hypothetical protein [Streptomyces sp. RB17]